MKTRAELKKEVRKFMRWRAAKRREADRDVFDVMTDEPADTGRIFTAGITSMSASAYMSSANSMKPGLQSRRPTGLTLRSTF